MEYEQHIGTSVRILAFGRMAEIMQRSQWETEGVEDLHQLEAMLYATFPALKGQRFIFSVDRKIVSGNVRLTTGSEVALLPPFSGG